jgi:hypothetical protein
MDFEQLKQDAAAGKIKVDRLIQIIIAQQEEIERLRAEILSRNPTERLDDAYSQRAEEKRKAELERQAQAKKKRKKRKKKKGVRRGRVSTAEKIKQAKRTERVFPVGVSREDCKLSHTRVAWRLESGRAVLIAYEIYRHGNKYGQPDGLLGRSEYGVEIVISIGYQVYCLGLSLDKACEVLSFFQQLKLRKSQADALLNQLARSWESEFDTLCMLLANSAVVHCDETSWSINSVWAFLNDKLTVLFYGVHKDGATLAQILDKEIFAGVLISDDAAVYQGFSKAQKCWAHLLRKAIKLTLQAPKNQTYRHFADRLLEIYRKAKRLANDGRYSSEGRKERLGEIEDEVLTLCLARWTDESTDGDEVENDYRRLANEIMRLLLAEELFVFVTVEGVEGTNNPSERQLRGDALARNTGRTNKTPRGAKRQSIVSSVLQSIGKQVKAFTLEHVIGEVQRWMNRGRSCFSDQAKASGLTPPDRDKSLLDRLILDAA